MVLVMDNLNTHKLASLYEAFNPNVVRAAVDGTPGNTLQAQAWQLVEHG